MSGYRHHLLTETIVGTSVSYYSEAKSVCAYYTDTEDCLAESDTLEQVRMLASIMLESMAKIADELAEEIDLSSEDHQLRLVREMNRRG